MRLAGALAILLWWSSQAVAVAFQQMVQANFSNNIGQPLESAATASPSAAPPEPATGAEDKSAAAREKTDTHPASSAKKRRKRAALAPGTPRKIVVREGGASQPAAQIVPGTTPAEAAHQRQNAEQLLGFTDDRLKQMAGIALDAGQQETLGQIRNYMDGARSALKEGDVGRANTLAQKAHLLSEDLMGR